MNSEIEKKKTLCGWEYMDGMLVHFRASFAHSFTSEQFGPVNIPNCMLLGSGKKTGKPRISKQIKTKAQIRNLENPGAVKGNCSSIPYSLFFVFFCKKTQKNTSFSKSK